LSRLRCGSDNNPTWKNIGAFAVYSHERGFAENWGEAPVKLESVVHTSRHLRQEMKDYLFEVYAVHHPLPNVWVVARTYDKIATVQHLQEKHPLQLPVNLSIVPNQIASNCFTMQHVIL